MGERKFCYKCMEKYDEKLHICPECGYDDTTPYNPMYITPGTILHDRYLVGILLEYNGEGAYYAGHDNSTGCKVLIREYMPFNLCTRVKNKATISVNYNNLAKYKAFMAEYTELNKSLARLRNNSNINPVLDMFSENNTTYTIFEDMGGVKMLDYLKDNAGELSWEQVSKLFPPLFTTIGILHNAGITHRAISPDTLYINDKGELKLSGFCVSAVRTVNAGLECELFKGYAAPEQYSSSSSSHQGSWTDVYGVCALLYRCLTGCMPVDSKDRQKHDDLCEPSALNPKIPEHVSRVIMNGMNLSWKDRIQTITELVTRIFEQPLKPAKQDVPVTQHQQPVIQQNVQPPIQQQIPPQNQPYIQQPQPIPQQNYEHSQRSNDNEEKYEYKYEKVNTVDKLRVPILIAILLLAILLGVAFIAIKAIDPENPNRNQEEETTTLFPFDENIITNYDNNASSELDTEVPDLVGKFYENTVDKYADYLTFEAEYEYKDGYEDGQIFEQDIEPSNVVASGSLIKLKVSKGQDNITLPDYNGVLVSDYEEQIKELGVDNYSLIISSNYWATAGSITMLEIDGEEVFGGDVYSNSKNQSLIIYYIPVEEQTTESAYSTYTEEQPTEAPTEPEEYYYDDENDYNNENDDDDNDDDDDDDDDDDNDDNSYSYDDDYNDYNNDNNNSSYYDDDDYNNNYSYNDDDYSSNDYGYYW